MRERIAARRLVSTGPVIAGALLITLAAVPLGHAGGPPIKTQQCSVLPLKTDFTPGDRFFVANRSNIITGYTGLTNTDGFLFGAPYTTIGGASTGLSLVSKNYLAGIVRDSTGRFYVAGPNTGTVNVYPPPVAGPNNPRPIASLSTADGLSQPSGLALSADGSRLYVANTRNNTVTVNRVDWSSTPPLSRLYTIGGLSAPLGLALSSKLLYIANRGANTIVTYPATDTSFVAADLKTYALQDLTGPLGIALNPLGSKLYVAGNGKVAGWYSVTIYDVDTSTGVPSPAAAHIGGDRTGLCNPDSVAVDPSGSHLYVANRESSGGSITIYNLDKNGSLAVPAGAPTDFNVQPVAMLLHDTTNQLGAPAGLTVGGP